jgi:hypothetical protein
MLQCGGTRADVQGRTQPELVGMADDIILSTEGLGKDFKGFTAVGNVELKVRSVRTAPGRRPASIS